MPNIESIINTAPALNAKFYTDDIQPVIITGNVKINLKKQTTIKKITISLKGFSATISRDEVQSLEMQKYAMSTIPVFFTNYLTPSISTIAMLVDENDQVFPPKEVRLNSKSSKGYQLQAGQHTFPFKFTLPSEPKYMSTSARNSKIAPNLSYSKLMKYLDYNGYTNKLPPSFNIYIGEEQEGSLPILKMDFEEWWYQFGQIKYYVKVEVDVGSGGNFLKAITKKNHYNHKLIEFLPNQRRMYSPESINNHIDSTSDEFYKGRPRFLFYLSDISDIIFHKSFTQLSTRDFFEVCRMDNIFEKGRLDNFVIFFQNSVPSKEIIIDNFSVDLLERVIYRSGKNSDENYSLLHLFKLKNIEYVISPQDITLMKPIKGNNNKCCEDGEKGQLFFDNDNTFYGFKIPILQLNKCLKDYKFNQDDHIHKGNRLYSFKSSHIERSFKFRVHLDFIYKNKTYTHTINTDEIEIRCEEGLPIYFGDQTINENVDGEGLPQYRA
ncbi:Art10p SCDLUD_004256 [Saccharomycodes ludwigii]|uniref:Art10p n=1 Tax=Saccharomycodes ludwigii TaxID=36035 RepID=UPI001E84DC80|nr:hypothetical protein SCDLUD_004256 [Saccharomycodes ludwigii]KAH3899940.1 hypothetical protein SCDLUD_004256 [Saccharomycodes ludwigii]